MPSKLLIKFSYDPKFIILMNEVLIEFVICLFFSVRRIKHMDSFSWSLPCISDDYVLRDAKERFHGQLREFAKKAF